MVECQLQNSHSCFHLQLLNLLITLILPSDTICPMQLKSMIKWTKTKHINQWRMAFYQNEIALKKVSIILNILNTQGKHAILLWFTGTLITMPMKVTLPGCSWPIKRQFSLTHKLWSDRKLWRALQYDNVKAIWI
jgi:hypothetical protein